MAGEDERTPPQSPRLKALLQHFECKVRLHAKHLDEDVRVTNERIGQMETAQLDTNTRLATLERSIGDVNTSLTTILNRLEEMDRADPRKNNNTMGSTVSQDKEEHSTDTKLDGEVNGHQRSHPRRSRHSTGMRPPR